MARDDKGRFIPGESGNPNGRPPKEEALTDVLKSKIDKQVIADKLIDIALGGDFQALRYIYDRIDGRPKEIIDANVSRLPKYIGFDDPEDEDFGQGDEEAN